MQDINDTLLSAYNFNLPEHLIAKEPIYPRENAKLLVYRNKEIIHTTFKNLFDFIPKDYLIVRNNTRVIKARFYAKKLDSINSQRINPISSLRETSKMQSHQSSLRAAGEAIHKDSTNPHLQIHTNNKKQNTDSNTKREFLYHRQLDSSTHLAQIKGKVRLGDTFMLNGVKIEIVALRDGGMREIRFYKNGIMDYGSILKFLESCGHIPLPPYIKREARKSDEIDYQSLFAKESGSIAAPTASLHFSESMCEFLESNYNHAFVTLHVGAGTFKPIQVESILEHEIHSEHCEIALHDANKIMGANKISNKILCIGTTALRSVEWFIRANKGGKNLVLSGENSIYLHPLNKTIAVRALLTNFHIPKSSLLLLVSSLVGREEMLRIYKEAIDREYRFYSYGDCMLVI